MEQHGSVCVLDGFDQCDLLNNSLKREQTKGKIEEEKTFFPFRRTTNKP